MEKNERKPLKMVPIRLKEEKGLSYGSTIIRSSRNSLNLGEESDFEDIVKHLEEELNRNNHSVSEELDPLDDWVCFIGGHQISLWDIWNGFVKVLVAVALGMLLGFAAIRYKKHELFNSIFPMKSIPLTYSSTTSPTTTVSQPTLSQPMVSTIPTATTDISLNDGLTATVDSLNQKYANFLKLPSNSLFLQPYRESTITIGGITPGCGMYWSLAKIDDDTVRFHGTVEESSPQEFEVTPRVSGEYDLTVEESCSRDPFLMRDLHMAVYVQEARRILRIDEAPNDNVQLRL